MSKKVYERLLQDFRDEWCKHRDAPFNIEIFAPSSFSTESPPYDRERYELLAQVALPFDATREITLDGDNSTLFGWAVVKKDERTTEARESFRRLCDQAGAALPSQFQARLEGLCHWYMSEPATWWIALLVYLSGQSAYGRNGSYQGRVFLLRPFRLCVNTIEQCRLNTDNPVFPEPGAGSQTPKKAKRSTERGEARVKLLAALTEHHKYADGSCLNLEPIGNNELARLAEVDQSTASAFFNREFNKGERGGTRNTK